MDILNIKNSVFKSSTVPCGVYSMVNISNGVMNFTPNTLYKKYGSYYKEQNFIIKDLEDNKVYHIYSKDRVEDLFIKTQNKIYFFYRFSLNGEESDTYTVVYYLSDGEFYGITSKDKFYTEENNEYPSGSMSSVHLDNNDLVFKSIDSKEISRLNLSNIVEGREYCIAAEKCAKKDCLIKYGNNIYFYSINEFMDIVSDYVKCILHIDTYEFETLEGKLSIEEVKKFNNKSNQKIEELDFKNTGVISKSIFKDGKIIIQETEGDKRIRELPVVALRSKKFYTINRIGNLIDFVVILDEELYFGFGTYDDKCFHGTLKLVYNVFSKDYIEPSKLSKDSKYNLEDITENDFDSLDNYEEKYNTLKELLDVNITPSTTNIVVNDLLTIINRLCIELQVSINGMGELINADACDFNTIVNLYIKDTYIKKFLLENDYIKNI